MKNKIFVSIFFASMAVFIACFVITMWALYGYFSKQQLLQLKNETEIIASAVNKYGVDFIENNDIILNSTTRITLIDIKGNVIYDTEKDISAMENHLNREEIQQAIKNGYGESSRYSKTLFERTSYYAILLDNQNIIRLSNTQYTIFVLIGGMIYPIIIIIVIAIILSAVLAFKVSGTITKPINNIDLESPDERDVYTEIQPLVMRINAQNRQINRQIEELKLEHERQDKLRREFTANVSHELKTPLTSISGYAELMQNGMVDTEDISRFSGKIYKEAQRLIVLIGDIIKLSQMDDKEFIAEKRDIDLYNICQKVIEHLQASADTKNITMQLSGEHCQIFGVEQIIYEMVYNICDNAIKYNKLNGKVDVSISENKTNIILEVTDSGIGIAENEIPRIFERFYRVDKSHSKAIGGTGLGLSIVKHGSIYHKASIECESKINIGTTIRLLFHKE